VKHDTYFVEFASIKANIVPYYYPIMFLGKRLLYGLIIVLVNHGASAAILCIMLSLGHCTFIVITKSFADSLFLKQHLFSEVGLIVVFSLTVVLESGIQGAESTYE